MHNSIGERIKQLREHFGLNQGELSEEVGMDQSNVSRIERNKLEPSTRFLNAMMLRFAANPEWIKTGDGEMFISSTEYIARGIELLGATKMSGGILDVLKDPRFAELQSFITMDNLFQGELVNELQELLQQVSKLWRQGDERTRKTLVQFVSAFPEVEENEKNK